MGFAWSYIGFEDTIEYKYVKIMDNQIWQIGHPQKEYLYIESESFLGEKVIITDTVDFYTNNLSASFQFRIYMDIAEEYEIRFYHKYDFEEHADGGIVETSYDNGITWQNILFDTLIQNNLVESLNLYEANDTISSYDKQPGFTGLQSGLNLVSIVFETNGNYYDTMLLKFTIASDSKDDQNEGWMLDEFYFLGITVGIETTDHSSSVIISPNPSSDFITIDSEIYTITSVEIFSLDGKKLLSENWYGITSVDISKLQPGIYLVLFGNEKMKWISKIHKL